MIKKSTLFRQHHFFELLNNFDPEKGPIDLFISLYLRHNPQLGSKDRLYVVERIYTYLRWKLLIETVLDRHGVSGEDRKEALLAILESKVSTNHQSETAQERDLSQVSGSPAPSMLQTDERRRLGFEQDLISLSKDPTLEPYIRVSFPKNLYEALERTFGEKTPSICLACNESAPFVLRVNTLKTTRVALCEMLRAQGIEVEEDLLAPQALRLSRRVNLFSLPEFKAGYFEVQDAGSQIVADLVRAQPGESVLDFCAGAGGKTLAFAPKLQNRGQIFLHDIREEALLEAKKRLKRAGIQNAQIVSHREERRLKTLKKHMDWVLVDAPCSGTGTLRRNPDMKWKFSEEMVSRLSYEQREIFSEAFSYLKPGGTIVYATCSLLKEENDDQCEYFLTTYPLTLVGVPFRSIPMHGGMDGFFAVCLQRKSHITDSANPSS
jgi:16S rRNA (cytosine(967)-C(5))-methyltransferase